MTEHNFTAEWCSRVLKIEPDELPDKVLDTYQRCLLDYTGALISGSNSDAAKNIQSFISSRLVSGFSTPSSSVVGMNGKTNPEWAAFANAGIAHAREIDDSHRYVAGLHPGSVIFSVALSLAEAHPETKPRVTKAVIAGYETACTIGKMMNPEHRNRSFHSAGTVNTLGAAMCAGIMLDLSREQLQSALGFSASMASGIFSFLGGSPDVKRLHVGHAAWAGIISVLLVRSGLEGPQSVLEHEEGFVRAFAPESYQQWIKNNHIDFQSYEIINTYFKPWEACGHSFSTIDACLDIREEICAEISQKKGSEKINEQEITEYLQQSQILIETYKIASVLKGRLPTNIEEAQFHLPFLVVTALIFGKINRQIIKKNLKDRSLELLMKNVQISENAEFTVSFPKTRTSKVTVTLNGQKQLIKKVDTHLGTPEKPLSTDQLKEKFMNVTSECINEKDRNRIIQDIQANSLFTINNINLLIERKG